MTFSDPIKTKPLLIIEPMFEELIIEPMFEEQSISIPSNLNYFYVPSLPEWTRHEYDGLLYEGTQYNWNEVDYRLSVDIPAIPEPASACLFMSLLAGIFITVHYFIKKRTK